MKKIFLFLFIMFISFGAFAQGGNGYKNAIGIRGAWGAEVNYQRYLNTQNRLELGLGINRYGFDAAAIYQWTFDIPINASGHMKWYAGAGGGLGVWNSSKDHKDGFSLAAKGQIGIEYTFDIPLMLSLDYRPGFYFIPETEFDWSGFGFSVRFCF